MRVLILYWGTRGGAPQLQAGIVQQLVSLGEHTITLSIDAFTETADLMAVHRLPTHRIGRRMPLQRRHRTMLRLIAQPVDGLRLLIFCKRNRVDVVFEVMDHPLQFLPRQLIRLFGVKTLVSVHDAKQHPGEEVKITDALSRLSLRMTDGLMTYSETVHQQLRSRYRNISRPIFNTAHPALGKLQSSARILETREITVGFFGRIIQYKGLKRLGNAIALLQSAGHNIRLKVVGEGNIGYEDRISLERARAEILQEWTPENQISEVISGFDILALPYDEASQSGVVGLALSAGVPIVATPVGGLTEQILSSGGGVVSVDMSGESFAEAILSLVTSPELYNKLSLGGLESARDIYTWERYSLDVTDAAMTLVYPPVINPINS